MKKIILSFMAILAIVLFLALSVHGCSNKKDTNDNPSKRAMTEDNRHDEHPSKPNYDPNTATPFIKALYSYAAQNQDLFKNFYCVCGCMGPMHKPSHKSLAECYVKEIKPDGKVIYDSHGTYCKACQDEAFDVKVWSLKGKKLPEIKKLYDEKYGKYPGAPARKAL